MENNYKEFIQKIKYMVEYDTSKTREDNQIITEVFEVHYSDGVRAMKKFNDKNKAITFMKDTIGSNQNLQNIAVYNAGPGFHSTADTDAVVTWWGEGSYFDNISKKDSKLAAKKLDESLITEAEDKGAKGREYADEVIAKCRAKMKSMTDDEVEAFRDRINDAFNVNEGVELNEGSINESSDYQIFFTTPLDPHPEDAEGWTSIGEDEDAAWKNLYDYFEKQPWRGKNLMTFYRVQIYPIAPENKNKEPFTQIQ